MFYQKHCPIPAIWSKNLSTKSLRVYEDSEVFTVKEWCQFMCSVTLYTILKLTLWCTWCWHEFIWLKWFKLGYTDVHHTQPYTCSSVTYISPWLRLHNRILHFSRVFFALIFRFSMCKWYISVFDHMLKLSFHCDCKENNKIHDKYGPKHWHIESLEECTKHAY